MNYALIINAFAPDPDRQAQQLTQFITDNHLPHANGFGIILYAPKRTSQKMLSSIAACLPVAQILCVSAAEYLPEDILCFLERALTDRELILFAGTYSGEELSVRLSVRLRGSSLSGARTCLIEKNCAAVKKSIYSGHVIGAFALRRKPYCIAIEKNYPTKQGTIWKQKQTFLFQELSSSGRLLSRQPLTSESDLSDAPCIIVGGRGLGNQEHTDTIRKLAVSAALPFAGSRPVIMNAWLPMNRLIGVSGTMITPKVCILLGVSGAPAFYTGIEKSGHILAINSDIDAPIMKKADLAICGDCMEIFSLFIQLLQEDPNE